MTELGMLPRPSSASQRGVSSRSGGANAIECVLVGDARVGKTAFAERLLFGSETLLYLPTVFDTYVSRSTIEFVSTAVSKFKRTQKVQVMLTDTAGAARFDRIRPLAYKNKDIVFLFFSVISRASLASLRDKWIPELQHYFAGMPQVTLVLVGTHVDKRVDFRQSFVQRKEGQQLAAQIGAAMYVEGSCHDASYLDAFNEAIAPRYNETRDLIRVERNDRFVSTHVCAPAEGCAMCHVSWSENAFVFHSVPPEWRTALESQTPASLVPVHYSAVSRFDPAAAPRSRLNSTASGPMAPIASAENEELQRREIFASLRRRQQEQQAMQQAEPDQRPHEHDPEFERGGQQVQFADTDAFGDDVPLAEHELHDNAADEQPVAPSASVLAVQHDSAGEPRSLDHGAGSQPTQHARGERTPTPLAPSTVPAEQPTRAAGSSASGALGVKPPRASVSPSRSAAGSTASAPHDVGAGTDSATATLWRAPPVQSGLAVTPERRRPGVSPARGAPHSGSSARSGSVPHARLTPQAGATGVSPARVRASPVLRASAAPHGSAALAEPVRPKRTLLEEIREIEALPENDLQLISKLRAMEEQQAHEDAVLRQREQQLVEQQQQQQHAQQHAQPQLRSAGDDENAVPLAADDNGLRAELAALLASAVGLPNGKDTPLPNLEKRVQLLERCDVVLRKIGRVTAHERWAVAEPLARAYNQVASVHLKQPGDLRVTVVYPMLKAAKRLMEDASVCPSDDHQPRRLDVLATTYQRMAWLFRRAGDLNAALDCMTKAIDASWTSQKALNARDGVQRHIPPATHLNMCALLSQMGRHEEALQHAQLAALKLHAELERSTAAQQDVGGAPAAGGEKPAWAGDAEGAEFGVANHTAQRGALAVAYHNVAVEMEYLHMFEGCLETYRRAVRVARQQLGASDRITVLLQDSLTNAEKIIPQQIAAQPMLTHSVQTVQKRGAQRSGAASGGGMTTEEFFTAMDSEGDAAAAAAAAASQAPPDWPGSRPMTAVSPGRPTTSHAGRPLSAGGSGTPTRYAVLSALSQPFDRAEGEAGGAAAGSAPYASQESRRPAALAPTVQSGVHARSVSPAQRGAGAPPMTAESGREQAELAKRLLAESTALAGRANQRGAPRAAAAHAGADDAPERPQGRHGQRRATSVPRAVGVTAAPAGVAARARS